MTASSVNGVEVIADEPTRSPLTDRAGKPVIWTQTRTLLLEDGSTVYGCLHCDYTSPNQNSIRPHLNRHITRKPQAGSARNGIPTADLPLSQIMRRLDALNAVEEDRDRWKARAVAPEKSMAALRRAIKGVTA